VRTVAIFLRISITFCLPLLLVGAFVSRADAADVGVDAILVGPASPGPSTLCTLKVRLKNGGARTVSYFTLSVKIDGQDVPVYKSQLYVVNIDPGTVGELQLYNFYSPSAPKPFTVQVTLVEAQWVQVKKEGTSTTTTPSGPIAGLPTSASLLVKMPNGARPAS
jgi:hypothetical protein